MLRTITLGLGVGATMACGSSDIETMQALSKRYELNFPRDAQGLRNGDIRESSLLLSIDGTFRQECVDVAGLRTELVGKWQVDGNWISFDKFMDCSGAWSIGFSETGANLHYSLRPTPEIVVAPDLNVIYIAEP